LVTAQYVGLMVRPSPRLFGRKYNKMSKSQPKLIDLAIKCAEVVAPLVNDFLIAKDALVVAKVIRKLPRNIGKKWLAYTTEARRLSIELKYEAVDIETCADDNTFRLIMAFSHLAWCVAQIGCEKEDVTPPNNDTQLRLITAIQYMAGVLQ
jgi:hypothetical protein